MVLLPPEHVFQESDSYTCGPCCLAMVYKMKAKNITLSDILADFHHPEKGEPTYGPQIAAHLEKNGIKTNILISSSTVISPAWKDYSKEELIDAYKKWLAFHKEHK